jgi:hypothetical protein
VIEKGRHKMQKIEDQFNFEPGTKVQLTNDHDIENGYVVKSYPYMVLVRTDSGLHGIPKGSFVCGAANVRNQ